MGDVYLATDTALHRNVALKVLAPKVRNDPQRMHRFELEARAASALNHPNVAHIYEIGAADDVRFIAMEHVEGISLDKRIAERNLGVQETLSIGIQILDALDLAHSKGVIHRDLKPSNVVVTPQNLPKILDFGLAKFADPPAGAEQPTVTGSGTILGTLLYMSPEQALGRKVGHRTDIFSFGIVLYEMLTGRRPFAAANSNETIDQLLHQEPRPVSDFRKDVPEGLQRVVAKCLEKKVERRYATAREVLVDLQRFIERQQRPKSSTRLFAGAAMVLLLIVGAIGIYWGAIRPPADDAVKRLAVLPFENDSSDAEMDYLSDGITESVINNLAQLNNDKLQVIARTTVFRLKGQQIDPVKVGREFDLDAVVTGKVRKLADRLSIQVDLVDTKTGSQLWGETYNRNVGDLFKVQEEIPLQITGRLKVTLSEEEARRIATRDSKNSEAADKYWRGRRHWNNRTGPDLKNALEYFTEAIKLDPSYADAHAAIAETFALLGSFEYSALPPDDSIAQAKKYATLALKLDDRLAEAHATLAVARLYYDWDWGEAEKEFRLATKLNASYPTAHQWYAEALASRGRFEEALEEIRLAELHDPRSPVIQTAEGRIYYLSGKTEAAVDRLTKTLADDSNFVMAQMMLGMTYAEQGQYAKALPLFEKAVSLTPGAGAPRMALGYTYAMAGRKTEALRVLDELKRESTKTYVSPAYLAVIYAGLGDKDQAFDWLNKAAGERSGSLVFLNVEPVVKNLRSDSRFAALLRRVGLP